jgi:hypothetical protein
MLSLFSSKSLLVAQRRWIASATIPSLQAAASLDDFRDGVSREQRMREPVGRSWTVTELRRKSFEDCHKLWYVVFKTTNLTGKWQYSQNLY